MFIPDSTPFRAPDSSNSAEYCDTLSGVRSGTLIGPPLCWGCSGAGGALGGAVIPSNRGRGPPAERIL